MTANHLRKYQFKPKQPDPKPTHYGFWLSFIPLVAFVVLAAHAGLFRA